MAFAIYVSAGSTTTQLNDGAPFRVESAEGLAGGDVIRHEQRGPYQHGVTDLGFRLQPRVITLGIRFFAATAALLDTYRAQLMAAFKPLDATSIFLSVQRDDGEIRTITCFTVGEIAIDLVPEHYPGHLHRTTITLRAASPLWRANAVTAGSSNWSGLSSWWLAGGAISAGNVKNHYEYPAQGAVNPFAGAITGDWSVAVVTSKDTAMPGTQTFAWADGGSASFNKQVGGQYAFTDAGVGGALGTWPGTTGYNYHLVESRSGTQYWRYWTGGSITQYLNTTDGGTVSYDFSLAGGATWHWRDSRLGGGLTWTPELRKAAIYGTVTVNQLQALGPYLLNTVQGSVSLVNDGDVYAYPLITLRGPLIDPVIVNQTTSSTIDLTGMTIGSVDVVTIDLRDGNKRIYDQNGVNWLGSATVLPLSMVSFALAPSPVAAGGTNTILLTPGSAGSAATMYVQITNQYMSWEAKEKPR